MTRTQWLIILCFLLYIVSFGEGTLTFDPVVTSQLQLNNTETLRIYSCRTASAIDGLMHLYHHLWGPDMLYRFDVLNQTLYTYPVDPPRPYFELGCDVNTAPGLTAESLSLQLTSFIFYDGGGFELSFVQSRKQVATDLKAVYFGTQRVVFVAANTTGFGGVVISSYTYYSAFDQTQLTPDVASSDMLQSIPTNVLLEQVTGLSVTLDFSTMTLQAAVVEADLSLTTFQLSLLGVAVARQGMELFWNPPEKSFYFTFYASDQFLVLYQVEGDPVPTVHQYDSYATRNIQFRSSLYPEWHGALFSLQASTTTGIKLFGFINGSEVLSRPISEFDVLISGIVGRISLDQLDEASFVMTLWNGDSLTSLVVRIGPSPVTPITISPPTSSPVANTPTVASPIAIQIISINSSTTVTTLTLTNSSVLVVTNEAVIEVTDCAALAGKLKYILSQNQYNSLLQNETLNILVLLTQCANGTFDTTEVIFEGVDQACSNFNGKPNLEPGQLTLLVTKTKGDCNQNVVQDPLTTGAIIGIVVGCAAAVVLIIILALYFSPVSAKVFPYAPKNKNKSGTEMH